MLLKIGLLSNYGDPYYIGLNGIEIIGVNNRNLFFEEDFRMFGECVTQISGMEKDSRML